MIHAKLPNLHVLFSPLTDYLEEVTKGSEGEENINNILQSANFDPEFSSRWKPYRVELVHNKRLDEEYDGEYFYKASNTHGALGETSKFTTESHKLLQGDVGELFL